MCVTYEPKPLMNIEIVKVTGKSDEKKFVDFPFSLYENNEYWVPALEGDEYDTFNPKKNGAYDYCQAERFLAYRDGVLAGRIAAIINQVANEKWGEKIVRFGWLDFIEDQQVLDALIHAVEAWGKERGCNVIKGPWGFTDMDKEGLLVEGFDHICPFTCLYNYPYYDTLLKNAGFSKDVDWTQHIAYPDPHKELPSIYNYTDQIEKRSGVRLVTGLSMSQIGKRYGMALFHMYNDTFASLSEFAPLNDRQIKSYLATYIPILDPRFIALCVNEKDEPVAFAFCVPSLSKAIKKSRGKLFPFGLFRVLRALKHNDTLEALMIGVHPDYQRSGAAVLMFKHIHNNLIATGIDRLLTNPQLEENTKVQSLWDHYRTEPFMRRRAYKKTIL